MTSPRPAYGLPPTMHTRTSYLASGLLHAALCLALAAASEFVPPDFAVRAGSSFSGMSSQAGAHVTATLLDTQLNEMPESALTLPVSVVPDVSASALNPQPAVMLDDVYVEQPVTEEVNRRRTDRGLFAADLPETPLQPPEARQEATRTQRTIAHLHDPQWNVMPSPETPVPERIVRLEQAGRGPLTTTVAAQVVIEEPGDGDGNVNSAGVNAPAGAQVDRLPRSLPVNREPVYPEELRRRRIGGRVLLNVSIGPDGRVRSVSVAQSSGEPLLDESALLAVRDWQFEPARRNRAAVSFDVRLPINFSIRR